MNTYRLQIEATIVSGQNLDELKRRLNVTVFMKAVDLAIGSTGDGEFEKFEIFQICPHDNSLLVHRVFDIDGTNLDEHVVCLKCGYGSPSLM